jgi:predicted RNA-binding protein YlqC (UPF0109 family)
MSDMTNFIQSYVQETTEKLVDIKKDVSVVVTSTTKSIIIQIKTDKSDCGKIIGKQGRIIDALKVIVSAIRNANFPNDPRKISLEIIEDENSTFNYKK